MKFSTNLIAIGLCASLGFVYGIPRAVQATPESLMTPTLLSQAESTVTVQDLKGFEGKITALNITPDGRFLVVGTSDDRVSLVDLANQKIVYSQSNKVNNFSNIALSADGNLMAIASDRDVLIRQVKRGNQTNVLRGHAGTVSGVAINPVNDQQVVSVSGEDQTIRVWDLESGDLVKTLGTDVGATTSVVFTPDGKTFITGSIGLDRTLKFWNAETLELIQSSPKQPGFINGIAVTPNGQKLVAAVRNFIKAWQLPSAEEVLSVKGPSLEINTIAVSPNSQLVATANKEGTVMLFDINTEAKMTTISAHEGWVLSVVFSPDGNTLISGGEDKLVRIWRLETE